MGRPKKPTVEVVDRDNLSVDMLKDQMVKGIWFLEACLFSQAEFEFGRMFRTRDTISKLEKNLISNWKEVEKLSPQDRLYLYKMLSNNSNTIFANLLKLHASLPDALESIKSVENLKRDTVHEEAMSKEDRIAMSELRVLLLEKIKEKTKAKQIAASTASVGEGKPNE